MGMKKLAVTLALLVVIALAAIFILRQSGLIGGRARPPQWVMSLPLECIDTDSGEAATKSLTEWRSLGEKNGAFRNPKTGKYTMAPAGRCGSCSEKIPFPMMPTHLRNAEGPEADAARKAWSDTLKCPKCGKNPLGG